MSRPLSRRYENTITRIRAWRQWHHATTYQHLLDINIARLRACQRAAYTTTNADLFETQIKLNQCGIFTYYACPGENGFRLDILNPVERRAALCAFAPEAEKDWLDNQLFQRGHYQHSERPGEAQYDFFALKLHDPDNRTKNGPVSVDAINGFPTGRVRHGSTAEGFYEIVERRGQQMTAAEIHKFFPVRPDAAAQLYRGWQITIADTQWGPSQLFEDLAAICDNELKIRGLIEGSGVPAPQTGWDPAD